MIPISEITRAEAWLKAARALYSEHDRIYNLILEVKQPDLVTHASREIEHQVGEFLQSNDCQPLHTVAETIFPAAEYRRGGLAAVLDYPTTVYPFIRPDNTWGTYALRITQRKCSDGSIFKPLEFLIEKLQKQLDSKSPKRAAYELDTMNEALDLKLYEADTDRNKVMGGQCLSHLSFKLGPQHELYLTAIYRYQWYVQKALGNLLGLARLQACIARELDIPIGPLVCHATLAILEDEKVVKKVPWDRSDLEELIKRCEKCLNLPDVAEANM
jgi:hypothetical protein